MSDRSRALRATFCTAAFLLVVNGGLDAAVDVRRDYLDGVRALSEGRLPEAVAALERAASARPHEEARARLVGAIPEPYLPQHHLALAYARLGRCGDARRAWDASDRDGVVATLPARVAQAQPLRDRCAEETPKPPATGDASGSAPEPLAGSVEGQPKASDRPSAAPATETAPSGAGLTASVEAAAAAAVGASEAGAQAEIEPALAAAAERLADHDYAGALATLRQLGSSSPRDAALAALVAAASHHALFELGGRRDPARERAARDAARRVRELAPALRPDPIAFAPRFVDWFAHAVE